MNKAQERNGLRRDDPRWLHGNISSAGNSRREGIRKRQEEVTYIPLKKLHVTPLTEIRSLHPRTILVCLWIYKACVLFQKRKMWRWADPYIRSCKRRCHTGRQLKRQLARSGRACLCVLYSSCDHGQWARAGSYSTQVSYQYLHQCFWIRGKQESASCSAYVEVP